MAADNENGRLSDTEGGERPVREQLKKAHIDSEPTDIQQSAEHGTSNGESAAARGRVQRKRSFEEVEGNSQEVTSEPSKHHARKRSRDSTIEEEELNNGQRKVSGERAQNGDDAVGSDTKAFGTNGAQAAPRASTPELANEKRAEPSVEALSSPKTKRSRLHSTTTIVDATVTQDNEVPTTKEGPDPGKSIAGSGPATGTGAPAQISSGSAFANTSAASPFGTSAGSKSPQESQTSSSAFASSGFGALASSSTSGFGAIAKNSGGFGTGGNFSSGSKSPIKLEENEKAKSLAPSAFGGTLGQNSSFASASATGNGFGSGSSGFGKLGSITAAGFGTGIGGAGFGSLGGGGLSSFASGKSAPLGKSAKPFGAPLDDVDPGDATEDDDDDRAGAKSPLATEEERQDERFYEQEVETGEEEEVTQFSCRAKLYNFVAVGDGKKEWRERGLGVLRFNVRQAPTDHDGAKPTGRLLMRADGSHRVVLNTPVKKEIKFGAPSGGPPEGGYMYFMGTFADSEKGGLELLQVKMKQANALDLHSHIVALQGEL